MKSLFMSSLNLKLRLLSTFGLGLTLCILSILDSAFSKRQFLERERSCSTNSDCAKYDSLPDCAYIRIDLAPGKYCVNCKSKVAQEHLDDCKSYVVWIIFAVLFVLLLIGGIVTVAVCFLKPSCRGYQWSMKRRQGAPVNQGNQPVVAVEGGQSQAAPSVANGATAINDAAENNEGP